MAKPIVDLKRSIWDEEKSDPSKGEYVFTNKVYYRNRDFAEGYIHPFKLKWCKYSENETARPFASFHRWKQKFRATPVVVGDDYWPEGYAPNAEGYYTDLDLILVKIPIEVHVKHRKEAVRRSEMAGKSVKAQFKQEAKNAGTDVPDDDVDAEAERTLREIRSMGGV